jgi:hypothetical protein
MSAVVDRRNANHHSWVEKVLKFFKPLAATIIGLTPNGARNV